MRLDQSALKETHFNGVMAKRISVHRMWPNRRRVRRQATGMGSACITRFVTYPDSAHYCRGTLCVNNVSVSD